MTALRPPALVPAVLEGDRRALARLLTAVENHAPGASDALAALFPRTGRAWRVGVTGAPGTGKSTLVSALARHYRAAGRTVAIIAVDPSSPFTGGAILGDRIRMRELAGDPGVFIRSMAARGSLGGLAATTGDLARVLDAAGFEIILVETVGAGQNEVAVAAMAQTTLVVDAPGLGDEVQAIKAGILEIADVLVVNKADHAGAKNTVRALRTMIETGHPATRASLTAHHGRLMPAQHTLPRQNGDGSEGEVWVPPIVETVATEGRGLDDLAAAIERHQGHLANGAGTAIERQQITLELFERLRDALVARLLERLPGSALAQAVADVQARETDPGTAIHHLIDAALAPAGGAEQTTTTGT